MIDWFIFILIIFLSSICFESWKLNEKQLAKFFVCPNCESMHQPKSFIDSKDKHINRLLMTCTSCSQTGYFELKDFFQHKCEACHNNIDYLFNFKTKKPTKWHPNNYKMSKSKILNPCPHCNTYRANTYFPELPEKERGIQYTTKPWDNINWSVFFLFLLLIIILWIMW